MTRFPKRFQRLEYARYTWRIACVLEVIIWVCLVIAEVTIIVSAIQSFVSTECRSSTTSGILESCSSGDVSRVGIVVMTLIGLLVVTVVGLTLVLICRFAVMKASAATVQIADHHGITIEDEDSDDANGDDRSGNPEVSGSKR